MDWREVDRPVLCVVDGVSLHLVVLWLFMYCWLLPTSLPVVLLRRFVLCLVMKARSAGFCVLLFVLVVRGLCGGITARPREYASPSSVAALEKGPLCESLCLEGAYVALAFPWCCCCSCHRCAWYVVVGLFKVSAH